jgi:hypothetical protein
VDLGNVFVEPPWPDIRGWNVYTVGVAETLASGQRGMSSEVNGNRGKNLVHVQVVRVRDKT